MEYIYKCRLQNSILCEDFNSNKNICFMDNKCLNILNIPTICKLSSNNSCIEMINYLYICRTETFECKSIELNPEFCKNQTSYLCEKIDDLTCRNQNYFCQNLNILNQCKDDYNKCRDIINQELICRLDNNDCFNMDYQTSQTCRNHNSFICENFSNKNICLIDQNKCQLIIDSNIC